MPVTNGAGDGRTATVWSGPITERCHASASGRLICPSTYHTGRCRAPPYLSYHRPVHDVAPNVTHPLDILCATGLTPSLAPCSLLLLCASLASVHGCFTFFFCFVQPRSSSGGKSRPRSRLPKDVEADTGESDRHPFSTFHVLVTIFFCSDGANVDRSCGRRRCVRPSTQKSWRYGGAHSSLKLCKAVLAGRKTVGPEGRVGGYRTPLRVTADEIHVLSLKIFFFWPSETVISVKMAKVRNPQSSMLDPCYDRANVSVSLWFCSPPNERSFCGFVGVGCRTFYSRRQYTPSSIRERISRGHTRGRAQTGVFFHLSTFILRRTP